MRRYKPWQLVLGYLIGLGVLIVLLTALYFGGLIVAWVWDRLWELVFFVWELIL